MTIACVRIPHFALRVAVLDRPELEGAPLVLGPPPGRRDLVVDRTSEAARRGVRIGTPLREVPALCPEAVICPSHPVREAAIAARILDRLEALSPLVEPDPDEPGCFYADLRGLDRLSGSPAAAATRLLRAVPPLLRPRVGVAPGKFVARLAAARAAPGTCRVVTSPEAPNFLAGASIAWLPLPPEVRRRLERLGLRTLGELAALPAPMVAARFGPIGRRAWELANGRDDARVRPRARATTVVERLALPAPATSRETCLFALTWLVGRAFGRSVLRDRHVRQVRIGALLEGGHDWEQTLTLRGPTGREGLIEALSLRLQALTLPGPVEELTLELTGLIPAAARQTPLPSGPRPHQPHQIVEVVRQLAQRYGASPLYRIVEVEPWSRIPERRYALTRYDP